MANPKLQIKLDYYDQFLELASIFILVTSVILTLVYYADLSEIIPTHFNNQGKADGFGNKRVLWVLVGSNVFIYVLLTSLSRIPHHFNYPKKITSKNAGFHYKNALKMMRQLKVFIMLSFLYILWISIKNGLGNKSSLGNWFLPVFIIALLVIILQPIFAKFEEEN